MDRNLKSTNEIITLTYIFFIQDEVTIGSIETIKKVGVHCGRSRLSGGRRGGCGRSWYRIKWGQINEENIIMDFISACLII